MEGKKRENVQICIFNRTPHVIFISYNTQFVIWKKDDDDVDNTVNYTDNNDVC